ncbi:OPT/YSL family transporter, partial [Mycolicibacterium farcinogenes]|nr:OPT/YSL family transporter [Mycolicibacterium farcinogenes]
QLVGATPWKQQVALVIGVLFGSAIIPPVLDLMQRAFGFLGAPAPPTMPWPRPQAALISSLAKGVFGESLDWSLIALAAASDIRIAARREVLHPVHQAGHRRLRHRGELHAAADHRGGTG